MRGERVWADVNLAAIRQNLRTLRKQLTPATRILGVVKADAYGHGALAAARCVLDAGASMLGVGDSTEALELREGGITSPILILGAIIEEEIPRVVEHNIHVTVHSADLLSKLEHEADRKGRRLRVHLKIDTGMSRLGLNPGQAVTVARKVMSCPSLDLAGVSTHFATRDPDQSREQIKRFRVALASLCASGITPPMVHAANSVAVFQVPESHFNLVRPGIALYGLDPGELTRYNLRPALSLRTRVAYLKSVPAGTGVGYDHRFIARRTTRIATCPVGYNDGYPQQLSNQSEALLRGHRVPVIGSVTMDYIMLDVTDLPEVAVSDVVTLIGRDGAQEIRAEDLARKVGTIPYSITCGLGRRVRRMFVEERMDVKLSEGKTVA